LLRQVEDRIELFTHEVVEARDDHPIQVFGNLLGRVDALGANQAVDEKHRLQHPHIDHAESAQAHQSQFRILEGNRVASPPFEVGEHLHVNEIDFRPERTGKPPGQTQDLGQDR